VEKYGKKLGERGGTRTRTRRLKQEIQVRRKREIIRVPVEGGELHSCMLATSDKVVKKKFLLIGGGSRSASHGRLQREGG